MPSHSRLRVALSVGVLGAVVCLGACGSSGSADQSSDPADDETSVGDQDGGASGVTTASSGVGGSDYLGSYTLTDDEFGTMVTVTVEGSTRTIETNALPDHETGEFPNEGNPNTIAAQDLTWRFPTEAVYTGGAAEPRVPGVAVNGVKFEPGTAETVSCSSGEFDRVEALQDMFDLGLDFNNAHVQPTGEYHYHGASELLIDAYESDWVFDEEDGDLDSCNGTTIEGQYVYLVTDSYPYVPRCLNGEFAEVGGPPQPPSGAPT